MSVTSADSFGFNSLSEWSIALPKCVILSDMLLLWLHLIPGLVFTALNKNILEYYSYIGLPYATARLALEALQRKFTRSPFTGWTIPRSALSTFLICNNAESSFICVPFSNFSNYRDSSAFSDIVFRISSHSTRGADIIWVPFAYLDSYFRPPIPRLCRPYNALQNGFFDSVIPLTFKCQKLLASSSKF